MSALLLPTYFPSIAHFVAIEQSTMVIFEVEDNFQKQTNRNRTYIYSPNGKQMLNIPIKHSKETHQKTKDVRIENDFPWQRQHFKSLEAAYRSSPYFEYFEDDIRPFFEKKHKFLMDLNFESIELALQCMRFEPQYSVTTEYFDEIDPNFTKDYKHYANPNAVVKEFKPYKQVFDDKHGFINNLSILDLIFNEGKFALKYLYSQYY